MTDTSLGGYRGEVGKGQKEQKNAKQQDRSMGERNEHNGNQEFYKGFQLSFISDQTGHIISPLYYELWARETWDLGSDDEFQGEMGWLYSGVYMGCSRMERSCWMDG